MLVLAAHGMNEPLLAVGDSLRMEVRHENCRRHACFEDFGPHAVFAWTAGPAKRATITHGGWLRAHRAGNAWVRAQRGDTMLTRTMRILPPVARLAWIGVPARVHIGDTLRLRVAAYDSTGWRVAYLPRSAVGHLLIVSDTPSAVVYTAEFEPDVSSFAVVRPGRTFLVARLVHRSDTLVLRVMP